ncbi:Hypothetical protein NTJ_05802 [Nesidiocoris tenuis]|uniref:Uncharacterized protein n=1 Tax=Nesidiocoris tenuis TaxID=355587 RepID=A0ABN7AM27_9HEMI|nr:Hypothetical protein NTJ_05802 [Nesidiocoris tenuis]
MCHNADSGSPRTALTGAPAPADRVSAPSSADMASEPAAPCACISCLRVRVGPIGGHPPRRRPECASHAGYQDFTSR